MVIVLVNLSKPVVLLYTVLVLLNLTQVGVSTVAESSSSYTVTDVLDQVFVFNQTPSRVISLAPSITETIFALGRQHSLIGVDATSYNNQYFNISSYVREKNLENVGGYWWTLIDIQKIIALNPDLVIADYGAHKPLLDTFREYGIKAFYLYGGSARNLDEVYSDILRIGALFNDTDTAMRLVENIEREFSKYRHFLESFYTIRFLFIIGLNGGIWVAGKSTFIDDALTKLGLINIVDKEGWILLSMEDLYMLSPDVIIVASMHDYESTHRHVEEYNLYSVTHRLYILKPVETDYFLRPGPLIINAPRLIYNLMEYWGFRKPPPISEYSYLPIISLAVFIAVLLAERIKKH